MKIIKNMEIKLMLKRNNYLILYLIDYIMMEKRKKKKKKQIKIKINKI